MRHGVCVLGNTRYQTQVGYDKEEVNQFLKNNPQYEIIDSIEEPNKKVYQCALKGDDGEPHIVKKT